MCMPHDIHVRSTRIHLGGFHVTCTRIIGTRVPVLIIRTTGRMARSETVGTENRAASINEQSAETVIIETYAIRQRKSGTLVSTRVQPSVKFWSKARAMPAAVCCSASRLTAVTVASSTASRRLLAAPRSASRPATSGAAQLSTPTGRSVPPFA